MDKIAQAVIDARVAGRDIFDLSQFNPSLPPPGVVIDKLVQSVLMPHNHRYSASQGITKLRLAFAARYLSRFKVELDENKEVVVTLGTKEGLSHLLLSFLSVGDNVLVPVPSYPVHTTAISIAGGVSIGVPLGGNGQELDTGDSFFERLEAKFSQTWPRPKAMILNFPHNPTTTTVTLGFFEELVNFAKRNEITLIHDNAYADLCYDDYLPPSLLSVPGAREVAVEFTSLSKGHALPGWRIGFCAGNQQIIGKLKKIKSFLDCGAFQPLQIAAVTALEQADEITKEVKDVYQARRDVLVSGLSSIGWPVEKPKSTAFLWSRLPEKFIEGGSVSFVKQAFEEGNVAICPGSGFDSLAGDFVRFSFSEPEGRIRQAIDKLDNIIA